MHYYIENSCTDPYYNLALEQYFFDSYERLNKNFPPALNFIILWRNNNSIIVGKNQNTIAEINSSFVKSNNINIVRRLSGGGAVYHDLGNLNFTFITGSDNDSKIDFSSFCNFIKEALVSFGVPAEISGRNDITAGGGKISGNAQYLKNGKVMHHGTLLYDSDLDMLCGALNVKDDKLESKGIKSVKSRVLNIRPFMKENLSIEDFWIKLKNYLFNELDISEYIISCEDNKIIEKLKKEVYSKWSWNYGSSPSYNVRKKRRLEGCGNIEILLDVGKEGVINNITFYGDFFTNDDPCKLAELLKGRHFEYSELSQAVKEIDLTSFFHGISAAGFLVLLFE